MIKTSPVPVEISNQLPETVNAVYQPESKKIFVRQGLESDEIVRSLSKEIAFARLDKGGFNKENLELSGFLICLSLTL